MTWKELIDMCPWLPETSKYFHHHRKGGGWIKSSLKIKNSTLIGKTCVVSDNPTFKREHWQRAPLEMMGSGIFTCYEEAVGVVRVGCETHKFKWFYRYGRARAKREHVLNQWPQYRAFVRMVEWYQKKHPLVQR